MINGKVDFYYDNYFKRKSLAGVHLDKEQKLY